MARILIIDDEAQMRDISSQIFELEGHEVATAADAEDALFKIKNNKYDVLLVDLVLPGKMNGIDIIKQARLNLPRAHIIAYSGFSGQDITEKVIHAGADSFITKPFKRRDLVNLINAFVQRESDKQAIIR